MFMKTRADIFWMTPLMGFCLLALFGGYAIYLPELFPTRFRSDRHVVLLQRRPIRRRRRAVAASAC